MNDLFEGNLDGFSLDNELIIGWVQKNKKTTEIWIQSNSPKFVPIKIIANKLRIDKFHNGEEKKCGFEIPINTLDSKNILEDHYFFITLDEKGFLSLEGLSQPFKLPKKQINNISFLRSSYPDINDNIPAKYFNLIKKIKQFSGYYRKWYSIRYLKNMPQIYMPEINILNFGILKGNKLGPHDYELSGILNANEISDFQSIQENFTEIKLINSEIKQLISKFNQKINRFNEPIDPDNITPNIRQLIIKDLIKSVYKVSVIIPTFNREKNVIRAIDSALNQTIEPSEVIVYDDGSTDNTLSLIRRYFPNAINSKKLILIEGEHLGTSQARNICLKNSKCEWIAYLDSDNIWHPDHLMYLIYNLKINKSKFCYSTRKIFSGRVSGVVLPNKKFSSSELLISNFIDLNCLIHHKTLLRKNLNFDPYLKRLNDWDFILNISKELEIKDVSSLNIATVDYWSSPNLLDNLSFKYEILDSYEYIRSKLKNLK